MCLQEHEPVRQVTTTDGKIAFKCNCPHYHPYDRLKPNEMDASTCIPANEIIDSVKKEESPYFVKQPGT